MYILACAEPLTASFECPSGWVSTVHAAPFQIEQLSPEIAIQYFMGGFSLLVVPLAAVFAVGFLINSIKRF